MSDLNTDAPPVVKTYPRLRKYAAIFTTGCALIIAAAQLYDRFGPVGLPDCDGSAVQTSIRDIFRDKAKIEIDAMDGFAGSAKVADKISCAVDLTFVDKTRGRLSYQVYLEDSRIMVKADGVNPL
jgi:hypothetical protein